MIRYYKYSKAEVEYTPVAMNETEQCRLCKHYYPGRCDLVAGEIKPGAWCNKFETRKEK